jgi:hypothetical protein
MSDATATINTLRNLAGAITDLTADLPPGRRRTLFAGLRTRDQQAHDARQTTLDRAAADHSRINGLPMPSGEHAAPLRISVLDVLADTGYELETLTSRVVKRIEQRHGVCPARRPGSLNPASWARFLAAILPAIARSDEGLVQEIGAAAVEMLGTVERCRDGEPTKRLEGSLCPYCRRETLVAYLDEEFIRCDHDRNDACVCGSPDCGCRGGKRHVWRRVDGGWDLLARLIEKRENVA